MDHLAFYQPASFGELGGRIEFSAPVRGHELTTRAELLKDELEHPRAQEEYFRIQLGGVEPAAARSRRASGAASRSCIRRGSTCCAPERCMIWSSSKMKARCYGDRCASGPVGTHGYQAGLPEDDVPPELLLALLGFQEAAAGYDPAELD